MLSSRVHTGLDRFRVYTAGIAVGTLNNSVVYTVAGHPSWVGMADHETSNTFGGNLASQILERMTPIHRCDHNRRLRPGITEDKR